MFTHLQRHAPHSPYVKWFRRESVNTHTHTQKDWADSITSTADVGG